MTSAMAGSLASEQPRFGTVVMNDGSVMRVAVDDDVCPRGHPRKYTETTRIAALKTLRDSAKAFIGTKQDDVALNILMYVLCNEPVSVYRVAKTVPYNFSLTYKKANKLLHEGMIRQVPTGATKDRRCRRLFEATVKGLLTTWTFGYMDDQEMCECLKSKWGIGIEELSKLDCVFKLLPGIVSERDTAVLQDPLVLAAAATAYENCRLKARSGSPLEEDEAKKFASRYTLGRVLRSVSRGRMVVFTSQKYSVSYELDRGKTFVYDCSLCDRGCSMVEIPPRTPKCTPVSHLLSSLSLGASPSP